MDARSIAATVLNGGLLTPATDLELKGPSPVYTFNKEIYEHRVYEGYKKPADREELKFGPNIADWPPMLAMPQHLLLKVATVITDPVTTTDELIPSGKTSSFRPNPMKLAQFTLSRKDPGYVDRARATDSLEQERRSILADESRLTGISADLQEACRQVIDQTGRFKDVMDVLQTIGIGSVVYAVKPEGAGRLGQYCS